VADFVFELPVGFSCWGTDMHEPLLIRILFSLFSVKLWQIKGLPKMFAVGTMELRQVLVESEMGTRIFCTKVGHLDGISSTMPEHMVRQMLFL
jgi:hypothetical protein